MQEATLIVANLEGADLRGANLKGALFDRANLNSADLRDTNLTCKQVNQALNVKKTRLPKSIQIGGDKRCQESNNN